MITDFVKTIGSFVAIAIFVISDGPKNFHLPGCGPESLGTEVPPVGSRGEAPVGADIVYIF